MAEAGSSLPPRTGGCCSAPAGGAPAAEPHSQGAAGFAGGQSHTWPHSCSQLREKSSGAVLWNLRSLQAVDGRLGSALAPSLACLLGNSGWGGDRLERLLHTRRFSAEFCKRPLTWRERSCAALAFSVRIWTVPSSACRSFSHLPHLTVLRRTHYPPSSLLTPRSSGVSQYFGYCPVIGS